VQAFVPAVNAQTKPDPVTDTLVTETLDPPAAAVFVSVTVPDPDRVPDARVMVRGFGAIDTVARVATPAPVRVTGEPVTVAVPYATVSVLLYVATAVGANTTLIVHVPPTPSAAPQVPLAAPVGRENGAPPTTVNVPPARAVLPVFVTVSVFAPLVVPIAQFPKASGPPVTVAVSICGMAVPLSGTGEGVTVAAVPVSA
jgi:hypothetical protein